MPHVTLFGVDNPDGSEAIFECERIEPRSGGYVQPFFTKEQADAVMVLWNGMDSDQQSMKWVAVPGHFLCPDYNTMRYHATKAGADGLFALGANVGKTGWLWSEFAADESAAMSAK